MSILSTPPRNGRSMPLMRFSTNIHQIRAINYFFLSILKSPTQIGFDGVINLEPNIPCFVHSDDRT
jgi:hypothetical protein